MSLAAAAAVIIFKSRGRQQRIEDPVKDEVSGPSTNSWLSFDSLPFKSSTLSPY
ncbi:DUF1631 domain-containing protein [Sesbania bispinosa]|nr:DUF1631 domain-containing protein [Sesbania bispinosa]